MNYALLESSHNNALTLNHTFTYRVTSTFRNWAGTPAIVGVLTPSKC